MDEQKKLENYLELRIPVKKDPAWKDWAQQMRSAVKAAGSPQHHPATLFQLPPD